MLFLKSKLFSPVPRELEIAGVTKTLKFSGFLCQSFFFGSQHEKRSSASLNTVFKLKTVASIFRGNNPESIILYK